MARKPQPGWLLYKEYVFASAVCVERLHANDQVSTRRQMDFLCLGDALW